METRPVTGPEAQPTIPMARSEITSIWIVSVCMRSFPPGSARRAVSAAHSCDDEMNFR